jgi:hypothetical protein
VSCHALSNRNPMGDTNSVAGVRRANCTPHSQGWTVDCCCASHMNETPHSFPADSIVLRRTTVWGKWGKTTCRGGCRRGYCVLQHASALLSHQRHAARLQRCLIPRRLRGVCCEHLTGEELGCDGVCLTSLTLDSSLPHLERCCRRAAWRVLGVQQQCSRVCGVCSAYRLQRSADEKHLMICRRPA